MIGLGLLTFAAMLAFVRALRQGVKRCAMTALALALSVAAFVYLVYAMLRPEKF